jgi:hypothetical protein
MAAGLFDHFAAPVAVGAGPLDHEEALLRADLAMAAAQVAAPRRRARRGAGALARIAGLRDFHVDFGGLAMERLFQRHFHVIAQVGAAPALLPATAAAERAAEDGFEDIADVAEIAAAKAACTRTAGAALLERGMAIAIIGRALLRIGEAGIGLVDLLELGFGSWHPGFLSGWNFIASLRNADLMTLSSAVRSTSSNS